MGSRRMPGAPHGADASTCEPPRSAHAGPGERRTPPGGPAPTASRLRPGRGPTSPLPARMRRAPRGGPGAGAGAGPRRSRVVVEEGRGWRGKEQGLGEESRK